MSFDFRIPYRRYPCAECPFRCDVAPGKFSAARYRALEATVGSAGDPRLPGDPLFACHKTREGREETCAGWLAVVGQYHLTVRIAVNMKHVPYEATVVNPEWPELFSSYEEMAEYQGY